MTEDKFLKLTQANTNATIYVMKSLIWYWYHSTPNKCVHVVSNAGAYFPVLQTEDEIAKLMGS